MPTITAVCPGRSSGEFLPNCGDHSRFCCARSQCGKLRASIRSPVTAVKPTGPAFAPADVATRSPRLIDGWYGFWSEPAETTCSHLRFGAESTIGQ